MTRINIAVTGVGGGVGQSIVKALQGTDYNPIGVDSEVLGTGLYVTSKSFLGEYADGPNFIERLIQICEEASCSALSRNIDRLKSKGIIPIVSKPQVIDICDDKLKTAEFLEKNNLPFVKTYKLKEYSFESEFPLILKPKKGGRRSIGVVLIKSRKELEWHRNNLDVENYVVQEHIEGDEYTCGTVSFDGNCLGSIIMKRVLRDGDTYKAFVEKNEKLSCVVESTTRVLRPFGACNIQLRVRDNTICIFEINARCSGTTASRALVGFNEPKTICDYIFKKIDRQPFDIREFAVLRYWKELVVSYDKIAEMKSKKEIINEDIKL
jgi:carbamoyl-phosphate synthase large subunit